MKNIPKLLTVAGLVVSPLTFSAGFMLNEQGVSSVARGHAGRGVVGDNAADMSANPATSALFDGQKISLTLHHIAPNIDVQGKSYYIDPDTGKPASTDASAQDVAPSAVVPGFYYALPINDQFSFGLSVNSHFGMSTEYHSSYAASEFANKTSIKAIYVTPSVAYKINDMFSVGLGLSYIYGDGEIKNTVSSTLSPIINVNEGDTLLDIEGDGSAFGWIIGGIWQIDDRSRLGLSYRSKVDLDADSDVTSAAKTEGEKGKGTLTFNLPDTVELSYFNQLNEQFALALGVQYIGWSSFKDLTVDIDSDDNKGIEGGDYKFKEENWEDSFRYSIGGDYRLNKQVNFHVGYAYDESPVPSKYRTLTIPDANRNWFTFGATLDFIEAGIVDLAFAYVTGDEVKVKENFARNYPSPPFPEGVPLTRFDGKLSKVDAIIVSIGYSYNF